MARNNSLAVFAHLDTGFVPAGLLELTEEGEKLLASKFAYGLRYLQRGAALEIDPVSLPLKDKAEVRGKRLLPAGGLPFFGGIRDAAPDAWGRRVIEAKLKVPANSLPESTYLLEAGSERVGALDIRTDIRSGPNEGHATISDLTWLMEAAERIEAGLPIPVHLEAIFQGGTAMGGARPKATVRDSNGVLWLAKFQSRNEQLNVPEIEAATLQLAEQCGMTVPPVRVQLAGGRMLMLIQRFDRYWSMPAAGEAEPPGEPHLPATGRVEKRLGFVSALTLLSCDEISARQQSYGQLAQAIRRHCHTDYIRQNNRELFARMIFNIFVSNDDDHLRNHGFLWDPLRRGWRLSPLYDVMPRPSLASERYLFLGVGPQGRLATLDNAFDSREHFTLSEADAVEIIARIWNEVREWRVRFESFGVSVEAIEQASGAFRHIDDISDKGLRGKLP